MGMVLIFISFTLLCLVPPSYGFDPMDPQGNITIKWDLLQSNTGTTDLKISISNYQLYRHIEPPGWKLGWFWEGDEVIWSMTGAQATQQGNCSRFKGQQLPHSCEKAPLIVDLLPGTPYNRQTANCCRGGVLTSMTQDPSKYTASFQMNVGVATDSSNFTMPFNFSVGIAGYSCSNATEVPATKFTTDGGRRWTQALGTWDVICIYSLTLASPSPKCCVSLSSFYSKTIVPCPQCSCGCQGLPGTQCVKFGDVPSLLQQNQDPTEAPTPLVRCTRHMCPVNVHWHVKQSYKEYWRVKMTMTNLNIVKNYSDWTLVVMHPNLQSLVQVFSFNFKPLNQYGSVNDTGMFWGTRFYNDVLLQEGEMGNVQSEMLLRKDPGLFTFREGWAFPRRISFNGDDCVMPPPDQYPKLPNMGNTAKSSRSAIFFSFLLLLVMF
ncbi:hypothetical protein SLEP1_g31229 [Rubroshorea leprosula]|uniref:COBRA-like protein n=1 Tax=Rubroshorea leprosula TaxID=152421 RepID=A0AAV5KA47_9ROSI|nr:hypothetical protein SLEP1_g31229 [Rubroshorea leprosula]